MDIVQIYASFVDLNAERMLSVAVTHTHTCVGLCVCVYVDVNEIES